MTTPELKSALHKFIDEADREAILRLYLEIINDEEAKFEAVDDGWDSLTPAQQGRLLQALKESEHPENLITHQDFKKKHAKWFER